MINWANWLVHKVCDGRQTPTSIIGNVETISLSPVPLPADGPLHRQGRDGGQQNTNT
jgi:hypothetical protein